LSRSTRPPAQDDYFYMRVAQIDGEAAWVSPVWIGEQSSAKK
jgi:ribosomal protein S19E (S16A)